MLIKFECVETLEFQVYHFRKRKNKSHLNYFLLFILIGSLWGFNFKSLTRTRLTSEFDNSVFLAISLIDMFGIWRTRSFMLLLAASSPGACVFFLLGLGFNEPVSLNLLRMLRMLDLVGTGWNLNLVLHARWTRK